MNKVITTTNKQQIRRELCMKINLAPKRNKKKHNATTTAQKKRTKM